MTLQMKKKLGTNLRETNGREKRRKKEMHYNSKEKKIENIATPVNTSWPHG